MTSSTDAVERLRCASRVSLAMLLVLFMHNAGSRGIAAIACSRNTHVTTAAHVQTLHQCRLFLRKLKTELKIPVLALVDSDPYGLKILSVYMKGASESGRAWLPWATAQMMSSGMRRVAPEKTCPPPSSNTCRRLDEHVV